MVALERVRAAAAAAAAAVADAAWDIDQQEAKEGEGDARRETCLLAAAALRVAMRETRRSMWLGEMHGKEREPRYLTNNMSSGSSQLVLAREEEETGRGKEETGEVLSLFSEIPHQITSSAVIHFRFL